MVSSRLFISRQDLTLASWCLLATLLSGLVCAQDQEPSEIRRAAANPPASAAQPADPAAPDAPAPTPDQPAPQPGTPPDQPPSVALRSVVSQEELDSLKARVEASDLDDENKSKRLATIQLASEELTRTSELKTRAAQWQEMRQQAALERDRILAELDDLQNAQPAHPDPTRTLAELDSELAERRTELAQLQAAFDTFVAELQARPGKRAALRAALLSQPQQMATIQKQLDETPAANDTPLLSDAVRMLNLAKKLRLEALFDAAQQELTFYDTEDGHDLPRLKRERFERQLSLKRREVQAWEEAVQRRREDVIASRIDAARMGLATTTGALRELYVSNLEIAEEELRIRNSAQQTRDTLRSESAAIADLQKRFSQLRERELKTGNSTTLGLRLRQQREELRDPDELRRTIERRVDAVETVRMKALDRSEELDSLSDIETATSRFIEQHPPAAGISNADWEARVSEALTQRKLFLSELNRAYDAYSDVLDELDREQAALADLSEQLQSFIDERILWIRSHRAFVPTRLAHDRDTLWWLIRGDWLAEPLRVLKIDLWHRPGWYLVFGVLLLLLQADRRRQRRSLHELAGKVSSRMNVDIRPTLKTIAISASLALSGPLLLTFVGWRLNDAAERTHFTRSLGQNLIALAAILFFLDFTRQLVRADSLADAHFEWSHRIRSRIRHWVRIMLIAGLPLMLAVAVLNARDLDNSGDEWERLAFSLVLLLLSAAGWQLVHPRTGVLTEWMTLRPGGWMDKLRILWMLIAVTVPLVLVALSLYGYHYTAKRLAEKLALTLILIELLSLLRGIIILWLSLKHRRLAIEQARTRRAALSETSIPTPADESIARVVDISEQKLDLSVSNAQSRRLVATTLTVLTFAAVWIAWADVLPALNYLDTTTVLPRHPLPVDIVVSGEEASPSPANAVPGPGEVAPASSTATGTGTVSSSITQVTWGDLIRAVVVVILTVTAARNVPGTLEMTILERLPIDASVRYAVTALARYLIAFVGIVIVANLLGLSWSSVQWLAAALTFGLAFGLQEIFANFVSGVIILFEQPVRVGDVVTIDNVTGAVSRIRMRSTTITDWDRKEYIVPNKEFITGKLLNWTLTDSLNRVQIPVRVAFSSDPARVRALLLEIVQSHPNILKDPAPLVTFDGFTDSGLNFMVRFYLPSLDQRLETINNVHTAIVERFREENVEIPLPQRDLHVRTVPRELAASLDHDSHEQPLASNGSPQE